MPQFRCRARHRKTSFNEARRRGVSRAGEARLLAADCDFEFTRLDERFSIVRDHRELAWLDHEPNDAALARVQVYTLDSSKRSNRNPNRCFKVRQVKLDHLVTSSSARVLNGRTHCDII